jgi:hypothetical protein
MNDLKTTKRPSGLRSRDLLDTPIWNKGTAFGDAERAALGLHGPAATACRIASGTRQDGRIKPLQRTTRISNDTFIYASYRTRMGRSFTG